MKTYLVTGAAGFIGANYIKYILAKHSDIKVVVLDALTYAGNLGTIAKDIDNERCFFIKGDICSREVVDSLFAEYLDGATSMAASSGGGGSDMSGWGKDKDEDEREWARRCAQMANHFCKRRRGLHR